MKNLLKLIIMLCAMMASIAVSAQPEPVNIPLSDQRAGAVLVFPYYSSSMINPATHDTRMTISNVSDTQQIVHLLMIDSQLCEEQDIFICLNKRQSCELLASDIDPDVKDGYLIAIAVDSTTGCPVNKNVLIGGAFLKMPANTLHSSAGAVSGAYTAEAFYAKQPIAAADCDGVTAVIRFDGTYYDQVGKYLTTDIQAPSVIPGQTIVTVGLDGDLSLNDIHGAGQSATGLVYNSIERLASFSRFLIGICMAKGVITDTSPKVVYRLNKFLSGGQNFGTMKIPIGAGVGLFIVPENTKGWSGIRPMHKLTPHPGATLVVPVFAPTGVCPVP